MSKRDWESIEYKVDKVLISDLATGRFQSRTRNVEEGIGELATNIKAIGLINPVTIFRLVDGKYEVTPGETPKKYELIAGQRRLMAVKEILGWKTIPARILPFEPTEDEAKAISLSENIVRKPLSKKDMKDSVRRLYRRSGGSAKALERDLGISYDIILEVIGYETLPQGLKDKVDDGEIKVDLAKRAMNAAKTSDGVVDEERAVNLATIMKPLLPKQQKKLAKISKERPEASIEDLADEARKPVHSRSIKLELLMDTWTGLSSYAKSEEIQPGEAAARILVEGLANMGFLE